MTGGDRRRPEATGGDRRRPPEATGGEARVKQRPCLFRSTKNQQNPLSPDSHSNGAGWRSWQRISCRRPPATHTTAASTHSEKEGRRRRRREAQHRREGSGQMRTQSATHNDDNSSIAPKEDKRRPGETRREAGDLRPNGNSAALALSSLWVATCGDRSLSSYHGFHGLGPAREQC